MVLLLAPLALPAEAVAKGKASKAPVTCGVAVALPLLVSHS